MKIRKLSFSITVDIEIFGLFVEVLDVLLVRNCDLGDCSTRCTCCSNVSCCCCSCCCRCCCCCFAVDIVDFAVAVEENDDVFADFLYSSIISSIKSYLFPSCPFLKVYYVKKKKGFSTQRCLLKKIEKCC